MEEKLDVLNNRIRELEKQVAQLNSQLKNKRFGLTWIDVPEAFEKESENKIPVLEEVPELEIHNQDDKPTHILIEGDNYHALTCLNYTHRNKIDVIYIDPPYNTGSDGFSYKDKRFLEEFPDGTPIPGNHPLRHSVWLSFIRKRLFLAKDLLSDRGVMIIHIDEHELSELLLLLETDIFSKNNNLGTIVWNKLNPKGDSHNVAVMHEYVLIFCKNKNEFLNNNYGLIRKKPNAEAIIQKGKSIFKKIGQDAVPEDVFNVLRAYKYPQKIVKSLSLSYDFVTAQKEFQNWLKKSDFAKGEKAYKLLDKNGEVFRTVSMAWPNKETPDENYWIPLKHPITGEECPVPSKGWRYPPKTMEMLLGKDEPIVYNEKFVVKGQIAFTRKKNGSMNIPERVYYLKDNVFENVSSIYEDGTSDDQLMEDMNLNFPYPKSLNVSKYFLRNVLNDANIILDFFAGSGTTLHATMQLNDEDNRKRQCILVQMPEPTFEIKNGRKKGKTGSENIFKLGINYISELTYKRNEKAIKGYETSNGNAISGLGNSLKYYRTAFVGKNSPKKASDDDRLSLAKKAGCLLSIAENTLYEYEATDYFQMFTDEQEHWTAIYFQENYSHFEEFKEKVISLEGKKNVYVFCWTDGAEFAQEFEFERDVEVKSIPQPILDIYKSLNA